jgi:pyruvate/2-oxoglutarate dehydrogenase complex dihydrolipoamide dehydrogenase (E3) component
MSLSKSRYHLVVIGAGTGGLVTSAIAAGLGAKVALIERDKMGGDCLNVGCVPSKSLIHASRSGIAFPEAMTRMRATRAELAVHDSAERFRSLGVDVYLGAAKFVGRDAVDVDGTRLQFARAVIATGARAAIPDVPGLAVAGYLTNETVFDLTERPDRLLIVGAGPIGCELGQIFARFGAEVTVVEMGPRILPRDDPDAATVVAASMQRDGVRFMYGVTPVRAERTALFVAPVGSERAGEVRLETDAIMIATGRAPNVEGLGLEDAGVRYDTRRGVIVDDRLRTSNPAIYAVGDVCSPFKFTHNSDFQARLVVPNALFFGLGGGRVSRGVIPWCTYTTPELAHVGETAASARQRGIATEAVTVPMSSVDRAVIDHVTDGFLRVHLKRGTDQIIGATLVSEHAGESISEITLAMTNRIGLGGIGKTIHPYPTQAEAFRKAADAWRRQRLTPGARSVFERFFRVFG